MDAVLTDYALLFMEWRTHRDAKILGLLTAGDDASVVVRENHNGLPNQQGLKDSLTRAEEVVAINQGKAACTHGYLAWWMM
jgi:hypothetical protein